MFRPLTHDLFSRVTLVPDYALTVALTGQFYTFVVIHFGGTATLSGAAAASQTVS